MTRERRGDRGRVAGRVVVGALGMLGATALVVLAATTLVPVGGTGCAGGDSDTDVDTDADTDEDCDVDNSKRGGTDPSWQLVDGAEGLLGYICPPIDIDYFWFDVPSNGTIASVRLSNNVGFSPVDYCYRIAAEDESGVGSNCDHDGLDGVTELVGTHYIRDAGRYFLEVRDEASDDDDAQNPYLIALELALDPDSYEPNDSQAEAKADGAAEGYISFLGDQDWYSVPAQAGQILELRLTTAGPGPVDLRYTLFEPDGETQVNTDFEFDGTSGATDLQSVLPLHTAGTYYLVIEDKDDDDSDLERGYSLELTTRNNPDNNEANDTYEEATPLTSGTGISGLLATRGDEDWFTITSPGVTDSAPALLEIDLQIAGSSAIRPAIDLIVKDPNTPCEIGDECSHLVWNCTGCEADTSTERKACLDAQCPSHECDQYQSKCRAAGICMTNGCALRHLTMEGAAWSTTGDARHLHTVAPMYGDKYYFLVRDFGSERTDPDNAYTLTVTVRTEQDTHEFPPNGYYLPYATNDQEAATVNGNKGLADQIVCRESNPADLPNSTITCDEIVGYLSFRGDQDWFKLVMAGGGDFPPKEGKPGETCDEWVDWDMRVDWSFSGNSKIVAYYTTFLGGTRSGTIGHCASPGGSGEGGCFKNSTGGTWGASECVYFCGEVDDSRPYYFRVMHFDRKEYDYSNPYRVTISARRECPSMCDGCKASCESYCCPNTAQPEPPHWCGN